MTTLERIGAVCLAIGAFLVTHSLFVGEGLRQGMLVGREFGYINWTPRQEEVVFQALSGLLTYWAAKSTVAATKVSKRVEEAHEKGVIVGNAQASSNPGGTAHGR